uniref:WD repeat-containing protein 6 n=1 Tax=Ananas comosus var. bracteatus TaxID=296719 RepID=A0A6V7PFS3_ANACO|nr:unnamed protein product [Ananas comosus var. bracteatus]
MCVWFSSSSHLFTADPRGVLKLWSLRDALQSDAYDTARSPEVPLVAIFESCFGARIMCIDASAKEEIMVCGDKRGNVTVFPLMEGLISSDCCDLLEKISPLDSFKGAHGISSVTSICVGVPNFSHVEIFTTGGDGCICFFKYDKDVQKVEFVGMKQVKELSTIQSVLPISICTEDLGNYAIGFTSTDFIMWDLSNETKIVQIPCGGWRRPYSYYLGIVPEYQNCFAYLKDHTVHIQRLWMPAPERKMFPQILHMQFHGREIHSLCFIALKCELNLKESPHMWIATGCEDGTVRLTRYSSEGWIESKLLGEHVGGSAVRSLCFIPKIYAYKDQSNRSYDKYTNPLLDSKDNHFILISVGSKQVLTSWILRNISSDFGSEHMSSSISFQWLSTYMPPKSSNKWKIEKLITEMSEKRNLSTSAQISKAFPTDTGEEKVSSMILDQIENDWRYLAVTAFVLKHADSRLTVCFVVVSCSDATLILRALLLPYRLWFDVALLVPQRSPVLALQHLVVSGYSDCTDDILIGSTYMIISGSTDGSITFWDLTETVKNFMQEVLEIHPETMIDYQRRPRTGRGSQGGRWWRSLPNRSLEKRVLDTSAQKKIMNSNNIKDADETVYEKSSAYDSTSVSMHESLTRSSAPNLVEVKPLFVLNSVHQSGVNCLHASKMKDFVHSEPEKNENAYCIVSGGDDQALNCFWFTIEGAMKSDSSQIETDDIRPSFQDKTAPSIVKCSLLGSSSDCKLSILHQDKIAAAHSSAVKGIWTDGRWAFSTGLDQRIRCWRVEHGKLKEHAHLIISVPEPETLDALICDSMKSKYQIAVAGRGMQMVEFSSS